MCQELLGGIGGQRALKLLSPQSLQIAGEKSVLAIQDPEVPSGQTGFSSYVLRCSVCLVPRSWYFIQLRPQKLRMTG